MNDKTSTIQQLKDMVMKFREERGWLDTDQKDIAISICLEAAELLEHFQWVQTKDVMGNKKWREAVGEEMSDVLFLLMEIADHLKIDVADTFEKKVIKQAKKYPIREFNPGMDNKAQMQSYYKIKAKTRSDYPFGEE